VDTIIAPPVRQLSQNPQSTPGGRRRRNTNFSGFECLKTKSRFRVDLFLASASPDFGAGESLKAKYREQTHGVREPFVSF